MPYKDKERKIANGYAYREAHREELLAKKAVYRMLTLTCACGFEVKRNNVSTHLKSKKHSKAIEARKQILEERSNPNIANLILKFLG